MSPQAGVTNTEPKRQEIPFVSAITSPTPRHYKRQHRIAASVIENPDTEPRGMDADGVPILPAYVTGKSVYVYCPHCARLHVHGRSLSETGNLGHRVAPCHDRRSPYDLTGYTIEVAGEWHPSMARLRLCGANRARAVTPRDV